MIINFKSLENLTQLVIINNIRKLLNTKYEIFSLRLFTIEEDVNFYQYIH